MILTKKYEKKIMLMVCFMKGGKSTFMAFSQTFCKYHDFMKYNFVNLQNFASYREKWKF